MMFSRWSAYPTYLLTQVTFSTFFTMMSMISAIYRVETAGLNPLQLVLVGTVLEATVFIFEVPTGIVADLYSRRLSVVIGYFLIGLGFVLEGAIPLFATILLAQIIWGLGATFTSGAEDAWLADELGESRLTGVYLRGSQFSLAGTFVGIIVSVGLGLIALNLPILIGGILIVCLAIFLALFMPETGFSPTPMPERTTWQKMGSTFHSGVDLVRGQTILQIMMVIALIYGLSSEGLDRLWEAHLLTNFTFPNIGNLEPVIWFGLINLVQIILVILATEFVRRRLNVEDPRTMVRVLLFTTVLMVASLIVFGLAVSFAMAVAAIWSVAIFRRISAPLYSAWLNKGLKPELRATIISMRGQLDAIGQFIGGPIIGVVALGLGLRVAFVGVGLMLLPASWLYGRALKYYLRRATNSETCAEVD